MKPTQEQVIAWAREAGGWKQWEARVMTPQVLEHFAALAYEAGRAALAQPEQEPVAKMREMLDVQGRDGTWNYDPYFHGMYNGMEFMLAMVESREPVFRSSPVKWLGYTASPQREWVGLTDEEIKNHWLIAMQSVEGTVLPIPEFARAIEAKLKEKNS